MTPHHPARSYELNHSHISTEMYSKHLKHNPGLLLWLSWLSIWHWHWSSSGHCCSEDSIPGPETSACHKHSQNKQTATKNLSPKENPRFFPHPTKPAVSPTSVRKGTSIFPLAQAKNLGTFLEFRLSYPTQWTLEQSLSPLPSNYPESIFDPFLEFRATITSVSRGLLQQQPPNWNPYSHLCPHQPILQCNKSDAFQTQIRSRYAYAQTLQRVSQHIYNKKSYSTPLVPVTLRLQCAKHALASRMLHLLFSIPGRSFQMALSFHTGRRLSVTSSELPLLQSLLCFMGNCLSHRLLVGSAIWGTNRRQKNESEVRMFLSVFSGFYATVGWLCLSTKTSCQVAIKCPLQMACPDPPLPLLAWGWQF